VADFYDAIGALFLGGLSVYGFFWNKARAQKQDEEKISALIHSENEKQDTASERHNAEQHKRINSVIEKLEDVQFELGYQKGYRVGYKDGIEEARRQAEVNRETTLAIKG